MTKATLKKLGLKFEEIDITFSRKHGKEMRERSNRHTVPQIFIDDHHIGGNDDLQAALRNGELEKILEVNAAVV
ncbi:glutaredoxin [Vibrio parahaemolyticus]|uniref:Glutaredoxin n=2 Tax=Vibrionaceae TaxID=641 RepID=A0A7Y0S5D9_VIBPH|nr:glutaredoxin [Vibrio parahaemolyticus]